MAKAGTSKGAAAARASAFVEAYISNGGNATEAAKAVGYKAKTAGMQGYRLTLDPEIAAAIAARREALQTRAGLTTERIIDELRRLALSDIRAYYNADGSLKPVHELGDDAAAALSSVEVDEIGTDGVVIGQTKKLKIWDKLGAIEKAMKHLGMFEKDNAQIQPITILATLHDENL